MDIVVIVKKNTLLCATTIRWDERVGLTSSVDKLAGTNIK